SQQGVLLHSSRFILFYSIYLKYQNEKLEDHEVRFHYKRNVVYLIVDSAYISNWSFILNARNQVLIFDLSQSKACPSLLPGSEKCILYSGKFLQITSK